MIDGHWGQYGIARMIQLAGQLGYSDATVLDLASRKLATMMPSNAPELSDGDEDALYWAEMTVTDWLNENVAQSDHLFGWHDGEFFYQSVDWFNEDANL